MHRLNVKILRNFWEKSKGLIGANPVIPVCFATRWGIHTFGVVHPIDILILDKNNRVAVIRHRLPPNRFFFWNPKYNTVIELPAGTIEKKKITAGCEILLQV